MYGIGLWYIFTDLISDLLGHGAIEKLNISANGWVAVSEILQHRSIKSKGYTLNDIRKCVENNDKKRYALEEKEVLYIKANQGHTLKEVTYMN